MKNNKINEFIEAMDLDIINSQIEKVNFTILEARRKNKREYEFTLAVQNSDPYNYVSNYVMHISMSINAVNPVMAQVDMKHISEMEACEIEAYAPVSYNKGFKKVHDILKESICFCSPNLTENEFKQLKEAYDKYNYSV